MLFSLRPDVGRRKRGESLVMGRILRARLLGKEDPSPSISRKKKNVRKP